jgi:hypothetical protein
MYNTDYSYTFYFPDYVRNAEHGTGLGTENWPFNPELKRPDTGDIGFFQAMRFTSSDTGWVEDNALQLNYTITNQRPTGAYFYYVNLDANRLGQLDFFCSAFRRDSGYMTWQLPEDVAEDVADGRCRIVLDNSLEGFADNSFHWDVFYERTNLKPENFIFVTGDFSLSTSKSIPTVYRNSWERSMSYAMDHPIISDYWTHRFYKNAADSLDRPFKALALNRLMRPHRIMIAKLINDRKLSSVNYSFGIVTHHGSNEADAVNRNHKAKNNIVANTARLFKLPVDVVEDFVDEHGEKNIAQEPDLNLHINQAINYEDQLVRAYNESFFSIVAETNFQQQTLFQSEKIFKPVLMQQPFVTAAEPGAIRALRNMGYDVYDDYINHSYDDFEDPQDRMFELFKEVERLCAIPNKEWISMRKAMLPRTQVNLTHLSNAHFRFNELHEPIYRGACIVGSSNH